jgi:large subunit ribosomal protein L9
MQAFANALTTIGKFILKKKTGDKDNIYGRCVNSKGN